jgi:hypothetical protein
MTDTGAHAAMSKSALELEDVGGVAFILLITHMYGRAQGG